MDCLLFNDILMTGRIPGLMYKQAKVITIFKPGKYGADALHFRPILRISL
jgi:hypothetical protein